VAILAKEVDAVRNEGVSNRVRVGGLAGNIVTLPDPDVFVDTGILGKTPPSPMEAGDDIGEDFIRKPFLINAIESE
jgi:hypothetical protein